MNEQSNARDNDLAAAAEAAEALISSVRRINGAADKTSSAVASLSDFWTTEGAEEFRRRGSAIASRISARAEELSAAADEIGKALRIADIPGNAAARGEDLEGDAIL